MYHRNRTRYEQVRRIYPVDHLAPDGGSLNHRHVRAGEGRGDGMAETSPARAHLDVQRARPWVDEPPELSLIHISEPTRQEAISYAVFCLKKKKTFL